MANRKKSIVEEVQVKTRLRYLRTVDVLGVPCFSIAGGTKHVVRLAKDRGIPFYIFEVLVDAGLNDEELDYSMADPDAEIRIREATEDEKARFTDDLRAGRTLEAGYSWGPKMFKMQAALLINPEDLKKLVGAPTRT